MYYPRIYSLSTIGIRQHFNADYRFHELRTDFSGESGSGKSMIADMIQLLLVGSAAFKSGTVSNKIRDARGMLADKGGQNYRRGYILLNIEVDKNKYISLGAFLETSSSQMQSFIIQAGFDWDQTLKPLDRPVRYEDLINSGNIPSVQELQDTFSPFYLRVLSLKKYHQLLFGNDILSIDLSNKQNLKSYATILRAFSRGKGFDTDSEALKTFLFGDEDQLLLMERYKDEVRGISSDFQQHERYQQEIKVIHDKQRSIKEVATHYREYQQLQKQLAVDKANFWYLEKERCKERQEQITTNLIEDAFKATLYSRRLCEKQLEELLSIGEEIVRLEKLLAMAEQDKKTHCAAAALAQKTIIEPKREKLIIDQVDQWLSAYELELDELKAKHIYERQKQGQKALLRKFKDYLSTHELTEAFEKSPWFEDASNADVEFERITQQLEAEIKSKAIFTTFADLNNIESLATWAIKHLEFPLSLEHESMLIHFQELKREEPQSFEPRYLPFPEKLFESPDIPKKTSDGFWVQLNGIYEFVKFVPRRFLNHSDKAKLAPILAYDQETAIKDLTHLKQQLESQNFLLKRLKAFSGLEDVLEIYQDKQIFDYETGPLAEVTETSFENHLILYTRKSDITDGYIKAQQVLDDLRIEEKLYTTRMTDYETQIEQLNSKLEKQFGSKNCKIHVVEASTRLTEISNTLERLEQRFQKHHGYVNALEHKLFIIQPPISKLIDFKSEFDTKVRDLELQLKSTEVELKTAESKWEDAHLMYIELFGYDYENQEKRDKITYDPERGENSLQKRTEQAKLLFETLFDRAGDQVEDKTVLQSRSVGVLANKLLPTVFSSTQVDENLIDEKIDQRLMELMNDMLMIGSRKVEILNRVFAEVFSVYNNYLAKISSINNYLRNSDHTITGGSHASLTYTKSKDFSDVWITNFRRRLSDQLNRDGLFKNLYQEVDINQLMIQVFKDSGGNANVTPEELLNPKSYFDIKFDIKLDTGEDNAGSNGQTYTANALLCLARLSLIQEKKQSGLKFMPIDEAEGLGGNYNMLNKLAIKEKYQLITMSIETAGSINDTDQYIYILHDNRGADEDTYVPPFAILSNGGIVDDVSLAFNL
jgi:hypothetical protein